MANKWMARLQKLEGFVDHEIDVFAEGLESPSPSFNFLYGNSWTMPYGYATILGGPPKGGKTLIVNSIIGQMHQNDPEAIAIKFDTEMREKAQMTKKQAQIYGIDMERYGCYEGNAADEIFDRIEKDIAAQLQEGAPIRLIIIDSLQGIQGRRAANATSVNTQQIGDWSLTIKDGLKRILPVIRKNKLHLIMTSQITAEMDQLEQMRGKTSKFALGWYSKHFAEYFMSIEPDRTKDGRKDLLGKEFIDEGMTDIKGAGEKTAHKIKVKMEDSSLGPKGRQAAFTLDYHHGIVNTHEEVFLLGTGRGVIEQTGFMYKFGEFQYKGKEAMLEALKNNKELYGEVVKKLKQLDIDLYKANGSI